MPALGPVCAIAQTGLLFFFLRTRCGVDFRIHGLRFARPDTAYSKVLELLFGGGRPRAALAERNIPGSVASIIGRMGPYPQSAALLVALCAIVPATDGDDRRAVRAEGGGWWIESPFGAIVIRDAQVPRGGKSEAEDPSPAVADDEARRRWRRQIHAIREGLLESGLPAVVERGKARLRAIDDPRAIDALGTELSQGTQPTRLLMVELLRAFPDDESTMHLAALALIDDDDEVRRAAIAALKHRDDPREGEQWRKALQTNSDVLAARAASALAELKVIAAVGELIPLLTTQARRRVEVPVGRYFTTYATVWRPSQGIWTTGPSYDEAGFGAIQTRLEVRQVTVMRSEVRAALNRLTGADFGFYEEAWTRWYKLTWLPSLVEKD